EQVLHIDTRLAAIGREAGEKYTDADAGAVRLRDQRFEGRRVAEAEATDVIRRARHFLRFPHGRRNADHRAMDGLGIIDGRETDDELLACAQNATLSPPLSASISRASAGVATSSDR